MNIPFGGNAIKYAAPTVPASSVPLANEIPQNGQSIAKLVRDEIWNRSSRARFMDSSLFSDPAWDMLLELFAAEHEQRRVAISELGFKTGIPQTTSLRWMNALIEKGLIERTDDQLDGRRSFVALTDEGSRTMTRYFQNRRIWLAFSS